MMKIKISVVGLLSLGLLSGCNTWDSSDTRVVLPSTPPLSAAVLEQTAGKCLANVQKINARKAYIPQERREEFETVMGLAENNCDKMVETLNRLKAATHQEQSFRQNCSHAESIMLPGTVVTEAASSGFDNPAVSPVPIEGEISSEPLG